MKNRELYKQYPTDCPDHCQCYTNTAEDHFLIVENGKPVCTITPAGELEVAGGIPEGEMKNFAREVNRDYECYSGQTDEYIAIDGMYQAGCANCPRSRSCDYMEEEI